MAKRRVVITGVGAVTPLGAGAFESFDALLSGGHGFGRVESLAEFAGCKTHFAARVSDRFDPANFLSSTGMSPENQKKMLKKLDRHQVFALAAAAEAIESAGLEGTTDEALLDRIGVNFATGIGGLEAVEQCTLTVHSGKKQSPFGNLKFLPNIAAGYISSLWDFRGPNNAHCTACAAGAHSISDAFNAIAMDEADIIVAGGAEAAITPVGISTFNAQSALSTRNESPEFASRPFSNDRDGFVMGEGAACLVLEELGHALARGARIYAELLGFGRTGDGRTGGAITAPHAEGLGAKRSILAALRMAGRSPENVDYINAHATSTGADGIEIKAILQALGEHARDVAVSATKSATGHLLGASGALAAVFTVLSIVKGAVPFTRNLSEGNLSEDCRGVRHIVDRYLEKPINLALSNSFGFGGTNSCLAFGAYRS